MNALQISSEWLGADGVRAPELAATWARLSIRVNDSIVTRVDDLVAGSTRDAIYASAYPLAEWIALNWWSLRAHTRGVQPWDSATHGFFPYRGLAAEKHDARFAGDGFFWPNLQILPGGDQTLVSWLGDDQPRSGILRYVAQGRAWLASSDVQAGLAAFVDSVVDRLVDSGVRDTLLEAEWAAIKGADAEERAFCDTAAALGLDPYDLDDAVENQLKALDASLGQELLAEFAAAADPGRLTEGLHWVRSALGVLSDNAPTRNGSSDKLSLSPLPHIPSGTPPWMVGWEQARAMRAALNLGPTQRTDFRGLVQVHDGAPSTDRALLGVAAAAHGRVNLATGGRLFAPSKRFLSGRALWRALSTPARPFLITTASTFDQQVERAFAAELLAPAQGILELLGPSTSLVDSQQVEEISAAFGSPQVVVLHQLENQLELAVAA